MKGMICFPFFHFSDASGKGLGVHYSTCPGVPLISSKLNKCLSHLFMAFVTVTPRVLSIGSFHQIQIYKKGSKSTEKICFPFFGFWIRGTNNDHSYFKRN